MAKIWGWFIGAITGIILIWLLFAVLIYYVWNALAPTYFTFMPVEYHNIPLGDCILFIVLIQLFIGMFRSYTWNKEK